MQVKREAAMFRAFSIYTAIISLVLILILCGMACGPVTSPPEKSLPAEPAPVEQNKPVIVRPATFKSGALSVSPVIIMEKDTITVSTVISNVGDEPGVYSAVFTVNGVEKARESISIDAEESKEVSFQLAGQESGEYELAIGESHTSITVYSWNPCEIRYDEGVIRNELYYYYIGDDSHVIMFTPETSAFNIRQVRLCGVVIVDNLNELKERTFTVKIWDGHMNTLLWSEDFPWQLFKGSLGWIDIDVPDVRVNDDFIVEFISHSEQFKIVGTKEIYTAIGLAWEYNKSDIVRSGAVINGDLLGVADLNWFIRVRGECSQIE
jgi:hypothetical protein